VRIIGRFENASGSSLIRTWEDPQMILLVAFSFQLLLFRLFSFRRSFSSFCGSLFFTHILETSSFSR
jgi:hypothetical protein